MSIYDSKKLTTDKKTFDCSLFSAMNFQSSLTIENRLNINSAQKVSSYMPT